MIEVIPPDVKLPEDKQELGTGKWDKARCPSLTHLELKADARIEPLPCFQLTRAMCASRPEKLARLAEAGVQHRVLSGAEPLERAVRGLTSFRILYENARRLGEDREAV